MSFSYYILLMVLRIYINKYFKIVDSNVCQHRICQQNSDSVNATIFLHIKVAEEFNKSIHGKKPEKFKLVVSSHNYNNTPSVEDLGNLVAKIQATGADIVKIATTASDITDVARIFQTIVHSQVSNLSVKQGKLKPSMLRIFFLFFLSSPT